MPRGNMTENADVKCPYYRYEQPGLICCEGVQDRCSIHISFAADSKRRAYETQFCEGKWNTCMVADAHNRKWDYVV